MLENVDLSLGLSKSEYKARLSVLQGRLHQLQRACRQAELATIVVFEGWDAAGKGTSIRKLTEKLEPRACEVHDIHAPRTYEMQMPWMWRFWTLLPNWGHMAIFDRSWYGRVLIERVEELTPERVCKRSFRDIVLFERALAHGRYLIVKFFLHIDRKEQKRRLKALEADPKVSWMVEPEDWHRHKRYGEYLLATEEMLERTETEWGPWTIVESTDGRWARIKVFETLIRRMEEGLVDVGEPLPEALPGREPDVIEDPEES